MCEPKDFSVKMKKQKEETTSKVYYKPQNVKMGFYLTVHRIQGQTIDKLIIDFNIVLGNNS